MIGSLGSHVKPLAISKLLYAKIYFKKVKRVYSPMLRSKGKMGLDQEWDNGIVPIRFWVHSHRISSHLLSSRALSSIGVSFSPPSPSPSSSPFSPPSTLQRWKPSLHLHSLCLILIGASQRLTGTVLEECQFITYYRYVLPRVLNTRTWKGPSTHPWSASWVRL